eukprot:Seg653.3 transcript_id=Seg653.3/GoldUCD/mRNA.D3Y31 product="hypothetical protein" protein_id=Seg653.3/GoldUCD/D3Y31
MESLLCEDIVQTYRDAKAAEGSKSTTDEFRAKLRALITTKYERVKIDEACWETRTKQLFSRCAYLLEKVRRNKKTYDGTAVWLQLSEIASEPHLADTDTPKQKFRKSFTELGDRQKYRRTDEIISLIETAAAENDVTVNCLLGYILKRMNYHADKKVAETGSNLMTVDMVTNNLPSKMIPLNVASHIELYNDMGRSKYQSLSSILRDNSYSILPGWKEIRKYQTEITPPLYTVQDPTFGVKVDYKLAIRMTVNRILETLPEDALPTTSSQLTAKFKDGVDGSGSHPIYNQQGNIETNNIIMYMFCPLSLEDDTGKELWKEQTPNSPSANRPLFLLLGKESYENVSSVGEAVGDRSKLSIEPIAIDHNDRKFDVKVSCSLSMIYGKMKSLLSGLGGAFCTLCTVTREEASGMSESGVERLKEGIEINRSIDDTMKIWNHLTTEIEGETIIKKRKGDYGIRKGLTQEPIVKENIAIISPLHALLRTFDFCCKITQFLKAGIFKWTESRIELGRSYAFLVNAKADIYSRVKSATGIVVGAADSSGHGGTTTNGNVCR